MISRSLWVVFMPYVKVSAPAPMAGLAVKPSGDLVTSEESS